MLLRIKRVKAAGEDGRRTVLVHYATAVTPQGTIGAWSRDPAQAAAITEGVARRVSEYHAGRANVGELTFEPLDASAPQLAAAVVANDAVGAAEFAKLQAECTRLAGDNAELARLLEEASAYAQQVQEQKRQADEAAQAARDQCEQQAERLATLAARVAELEQSPPLPAEGAQEPAAKSGKRKQP